MEGMEIPISERFDDADILVPKTRRNLDGIPLETAEEFSVKGDARITKLGDEFACLFVERDNDGNLPVVYKTEFFGDFGELKMKRKVGVLLDAKVVDNRFGVPASTLLKVVEIEVMADGLLSDEIGVGVNKLVSDLGSFAEVGLCFLVLRPENVSCAVG